MAQNITLLGASYPDVPSVVLPKTGGGNASFVDVSGASLSSSDGAKILTGESAFGNDGKLISGTMPDYNVFPLTCQNFYNYSYTPPSDTTELLLNAPPLESGLNNRPLQLLLIFVSIGTITVTSTASQPRYIVSAQYSGNGNIRENRYWSFHTCRIARGSSQASMSVPIYSTSTETDSASMYIKNKDQLYSGGASVVINNSSSNIGHWCGGKTHYIMMGA